LFWVAIFFEGVGGFGVDLDVGDGVDLDFFAVGAGGVEAVDGVASLEDFVGGGAGGVSAAVQQFVFLREPGGGVGVVAGCEDEVWVRGVRGREKVCMTESAATIGIVAFARCIVACAENRPLDG